MQVYHEAEQKMNRSFGIQRGLYTLKHEPQTSNVTTNVASRDIYAVCRSRKKIEKQTPYVSMNTALQLSLIGGFTRHRKGV